MASGSSGVHHFGASPLSMAACVLAATPAAVSACADGSVSARAREGKNGPNRFACGHCECLIEKEKAMRSLSGQERTCPGLLPTLAEAAELAPVLFAFAWCCLLENPVANSLNKT